MTLLATLSLVLASSAGARTLAAPEATINGVTPLHAMVGKLVTISGTNLDGTRGVSFGTVAATSVSVDPNGMWVRAVVPSGVSPGSIYLTLDVSGSSHKVGPITIDPGSTTPQANPQPTVKASSSGAPVKVVVAPRILGLSPTSGRIGVKVRIRGANLGGTRWVKFGTVRANFTVASSTAIIATVPKHAHSAKVTVHTSGGNGVSTQRFSVITTAY